jgi:hypothetical protein
MHTNKKSNRIQEVRVSLSVIAVGFSVYTFPLCCHTLLPAAEPLLEALQQASLTSAVVIRTTSRTRLHIQMDRNSSTTIHSSFKIPVSLSTLLIIFPLMMNHTSRWCSVKFRATECPTHTLHAEWHEMPTVSEPTSVFICNPQGTWMRVSLQMLAFFPSVSVPPFILSDLSGLQREKA